MLTALTKDPFYSFMALLIVAQILSVIIWGICSIRFINKNVDNFSEAIKSVNKGQNRED